MREGEREYNVYVCAKITDEILVEAKNSIDAADIAKEIFLDELVGEQAINLIKLNLVVREVEQAV